MPNHCSNRLTIIGPKADIARILDAIKNDEIINSLYPCPPELAISSGSADISYEIIYGDRAAKLMAMPNWNPYDYDNKFQFIMHLAANDHNFFAEAEIRRRNMKKYGFTNWYDWCNANWGTKWGDYDTELIDHSDRKLVYIFDSAWAPPEAAINNIAADWPTLGFYLSYEEPGAGYHGWTKWYKGELINDFCEDINTWDEEIREPKDDNTIEEMIT